METSRLAELLQPFLENPGAAGSSLSENQFINISMYIDMLLRWNARMNLTAVREPDDIVTRHFGESLFAARHLFPVGAKFVGGDQDAVAAPAGNARRTRVFDVGSGAGFPGLPLKIWASEIELTMIESNYKKAIFLREVVRHLALNHADVFARRAEELAGSSADVVTLRAVERFERILPIAAGLVAPGGRIGLLIGQAQVSRARELLTQFKWEDAINVPLSDARVLLIGISGSSTGESRR